MRQLLPKARNLSAQLNLRIFGHFFLLALLAFVDLSDGIYCITHHYIHDQKEVHNTKGTDFCVKQSVPQQSYLISI